MTSSRLISSIRLPAAAIASPGSLPYLPSNTMAGGSISASNASAVLTNPRWTSLVLKSS